MRDNHFTESFCFLSNVNMNQPWVSIISPPFWNFPHTSLPIPPLQADTEPLFEFPEPHSKFPLAVHPTHGNASFHVTPSIHPTLSSPLPMPVSPLLPCKQIPWHHLSRFCVYVLEYDIYLPLSDSLHLYDRF